MHLVMEGDTAGSRVFGDLSGRLTAKITELCKLAVKLHSLDLISTFTEENMTSAQP